MNLNKFLDQVIEYTFYALFVLVPLILTPWNYELFEFNKMLVVYSSTIIILASWVIKMIINKKWIFKKSILDFPLLLFLSSQILSSIFSIHRQTSIWGYYSRFHGSLISTLCYLVLYWAYVTNMQRKVIKTLFFLLGTATIVCFYGILERFGIDAHYWVQDVQNRVFSTLGQPNWLGAYIDALIFIPLVLLLKSKSKGKKILFSAVYFIMFFCLLFTNSKSAILAFWLIFFFFTITYSILIKNKWKLLGAIFAVSMLFYLLIGGKTYTYLQKADQWIKLFLPQQEEIVEVQKNSIPGVPQYAPTVSESSEIRKIVWLGAIEIWKNYPVFGSGVETFAYSYYQFRPQTHNLLSEWDFLYNKAHNEYLNMMSTTGTWGIITYLAVIFTSLFIFYKQIRKNKENRALLLSFLSGYLTILITNFFGFSVVVVALLFSLLPSFALSLNTNHENEKKLKTNKYKKNNKINISTIKLIQILVVLATAFYGLIYIVNIWRADYFFAKGKNYSRANYLVQARELLSEAIIIRPNKALFHSQLAENDAKLALLYYQSTEATESAELIDQLTQSTLQHSQRALELNPVHINLYKSVTKTLLYLQVIDSQYLQTTVNILEQAIMLAPSDAKLYYNLGLVHNQLGNKEQAVKYWEKAVSLKPNYAKVYIKLAKLYKEDEPEKAIEKLEFLLENIFPDNEQAKQMLEELKNT